MEDEVEKATSSLRAWTVQVRRGHAEELLKTVSECARKNGDQVLVVKGEFVFGSDHLRTAFYHAKKAIDEGRNASDSIAMETLLYLSGERQLNSAIMKMSVDGATEEVVVSDLGGGCVRPETSWQVLPRVPDSINMDRLRRFGISNQELETVNQKSAIELVLERVAAVDILKK